MFIIIRSKSYYTASGIITPVGGHPKLITCLYMFRALCAHHHQVKIVLYSIWYRQTCRWATLVYYMPLHVSSTMCSKHIEAYNKRIIKQEFVNLVG